MNHGWQTKCWGLTRLIFHNDHHSLHELMVVAGFQCSKHRHADRANSFYVDSGSLQILTYEDASPKHAEFHHVSAGERFEVPSGVWHRFQVLESGRVFETYWPDRGGIVRLDDIEREDVGGAFS